MAAGAVPSVQTFTVERVHRPLPTVDISPPVTGWLAVTLLEAGKGTSVKPDAVMVVVGVAETYTAEHNAPAFCTAVAVGVVPPPPPVAVGEPLPVTVTVLPQAASNNTVIAKTKPVLTRTLDRIKM